MHISSAEKKQFQKKILKRYNANKRDLPWRQTHDPYKILVSEVMLQQTQVPRVIQKFARWMELWPTVQDLAQASRADVLREWSGLGFNRRAINLHEACKKVFNDIASYYLEGNEGSSSQLSFEKTNSNTRDSSLCSEGHALCTKRSIDFFMSDYVYLRSLPGVGDYTANAILAFAYNQEVPVMDINIKRVLLYSFQLPPEIPMRELQELALSLVPTGKSRDWHNALMDYGSQVLHSKATGIRSPKQSTFKGSDREVRGWIMKQLALKPSLLITDICTKRPEKNIPVIIQGLVDDNMISIHGRGLKKMLTVNNGL